MGDQGSARKEYLKVYYDRSDLRQPGRKIFNFAFFEDYGPAADIVSVWNWMLKKCEIGR